MQKKKTHSLDLVMPVGTQQAWHWPFWAGSPWHRPQLQSARCISSHWGDGPLKAILQESLRHSILVHLSFDSSLLNFWRLWLKAAAHSFTFNYSPIDGCSFFFKLVKLLWKKKVLNNLFIMLLRQSHVLLGYACLCCDTEVNKEAL